MLISLGAGFRRVQLLRRGRIDHRAVLAADVVALAHALGRVVQFPEHLQQVFVFHFGLVIHHQHHFAVAGQAGADFFVGRVRREAAGVADHAADHAVALPELALGAPEATQAEDRETDVIQEGPQQRVAVDEVGFRQGHRGFAARQSLFCSRKHVFIHQNFRAQDHDQSSRQVELAVKGQTASVPECYHAVRRQVRVDSA